MTSDERRLHVLRAIVQDYVRTSEPVGSKALLERHQLGVSAATVRNDMALLEEEGLIAAPHTSAGRIPTDAGYRLFVDRLAAIKPMTKAERRAIEEFLAGAVDLDDVVGRSVRLLASLTNQVAVMQYPSLSRSTVRHIELVAVGGSRLMVVLIVNTGRVEQRVVDVGREMTGLGGEQTIQDVRAMLNAEATGRPLPDVSARLGAALETIAQADRPVAEAVVDSLGDALLAQTEERVVLAGTANLARVVTDFPRSIGPVLEALEEHVVLLKLMSSMSTLIDDDAVAVSIGAENPYEGFQSTSVITTNYGSAGGLGVVGPTRMDYPTTMTSVRAVAHYVSEILDS
ncbi:heat-inducible transcriptional repressor HrcA [Ornithinimicrobium faecis]|uniref:Heat-inducible transcription repressor HrcA n=1 Tax=Ornithinimicrobium faecis TaxID=2934158 RepID=A0ABY4YNZ4_9MICO|nr:heat-inducible transcriptional repressor HrcA [Ornithinimicrobium sp. HY1793]USQ78502.1 heat-inducible transcriptional repressor HrcA [Ornithinimicrobium sp. HY1793]